jgi:hypothetical protein
VSELEARLTRLGDAIDWPATPDVAGAVERRLEPRRRGRLAVRRPVAIALAGLLLLTGGAFAASPDLREAVGDLFGIGGVEIKRVPEVPRVRPGADLGLGRPATLAEVRRRAGFRVIAPARFDSVWFSRQPPGGQVSFVRERPRRLVLLEFRGDQVRAFIEKSIGPGTTARNVSVNGGAGVWLDGRPHEVIYRDADGVIRADAVRIAGSVLLWEQDGLTLRLEGIRTLAEALAYAAALR